VLIFGLLWATAARCEEPAASEVYAEARKAEKKGQMAMAYLLYSQAAALEPGNATYWLRSQAVRTRAALEAGTMPAPCRCRCSPNPRRKRCSALPPKRI
jgi:hypothetical protein